MRKYFGPKLKDIHVHTHTHMHRSSSSQLRACLLICAIDRPFIPQPAQLSVTSMSLHLQRLHSRAADAYVGSVMQFAYSLLRLITGIENTDPESVADEMLGLSGSKKETDRGGGREIREEKE